MIAETLKAICGPEIPVDFEIDSSRLVQQIKVPSPADAIAHDPRIFTSSGTATAWFNASVADVNGKTQMLYRVESKPWFRLAQIARVDLDSNWQPRPLTNSLFSLKSKKGKLFAEDPRWIRYGDGWLMSYTDSYDMALASFKSDGEINESWFLERPQQTQPCEKNWAFFEWDGRLFAIYKIVPHAIIEIFGTKTKFVGTTDAHAPLKVTDFWKYGHPRGGTSPIWHEGKFWHFFHSHTMAGMGKHGAIRRYHVGLYAFEPKPPFTVLGRTPEPLMSADLDEDAPQDRPSHHRVVFPCGAMRTARGWWISYGWNDCRIRMRYVDDDEVNAKMKWR